MVEGYRLAAIGYRQDQVGESSVRDWGFFFFVIEFCDPRYDLHVLIDLVKRGCQPDLAARILAPLYDESGV